MLTLINYQPAGMCFTPLASLHAARADSAISTSK